MAGCQKRPAPAVADAHWKPEIEWNDAEYSIEDYKRMQPHRPILAVFSSKWEPPPVILLRGKKFMDILREGQFLCLNYESTAPDSIGQAELKRRGYQSPHVFVVSIPDRGDSHYPLTYAEDELLAFVKKISKEAVQAGRGGGDKPPN